VDAEPTGRTIDGTPWEEPRPPHLPDAVTRVSPWVIPFLLLAGVQVVAAWLDWAAQGDLRYPNAVEFIVAQWLPGVCASLLGAAVFYRHPDAHRRLPLLVFGVVLLAVTALIGSAERPLMEWFTSLSPAADDTWIFVAGATNRIAMAVIRVVGLVCITAGLEAARGSAGVVSGRRLRMVVAAVAVVGSVVTVLSFLGATGESNDLFTPFNAVAVVLGFLVTIAWAHLLVVAVGGWLAGERPRVGWLLVALGAIVEIALRVLISSGGLLVSPETSGSVVQLIGYASVASWLLLLLAFATGLPARPATATTGLMASTTRDSAAG
jgi:hypothetical protein